MMTCPVYASGPNIKLPTFNTTWTTPVAVYNYFPIETDMFRFKPHNQQTLVSASEVKDISSLDENNLKELTGKNFYQMMQKNPIYPKNKLGIYGNCLHQTKLIIKLKYFFMTLFLLKIPVT